MKTIHELEVEIKKRAPNKDKKFVLNGYWKKFLRKQDGFSVYVVDGEWVRNNLCVLFGMGGHGYVHEFISMNEIWVAAYHKNGVGARKKYFETTINHEIIECQQMAQGKGFRKAHKIAIQRDGYLE